MTHLVLIGGGHSHVEVLRQFGMRPMPDVRITLISRRVDTPYSGMLPGLIAGHYTYDDAHIDLKRLARFAGAAAMFEEVTAIEPARRLVHCGSLKPVPYDVLSINIGSTPNAMVPGAAEHAIAVKPIDRFLPQWDALRDRVMSDDRSRTIAVVGGGAGGVELLLSVQFRLRALLEAQGRPADRLAFHLFTSGDRILPTHNARVGATFDRILEARGVRVHTSSEIRQVTPGRLRVSAGVIYDADEILWTTEARAASWIPDSGLATDPEGFISVGSTLESVSHPGIFAAGDVASMVGRRLQKSGVYAVRQGQALAPNLRRALAGRPLQPYTPQRRFLSLISTGDRFAVASRGPFAFHGRWVWRWKDAIDRRFMRQYRHLPAGPAEAGHYARGK